MLILRPVLSASSARRDSFSCASWCLCERRLMSSVQVLQLFGESPLDAGLLIWCCLLHNPVDYQKEDGRRQYAALTNTGLYLECVRQLPVVYDLAAGVVVQLLYDGNELGGGGGGGSRSVALASRWRRDPHCRMPFGSRRILSTVGSAIPATAQWWFAAWRYGLCRICLDENLPAPLVEFRPGPSWFSPGWFLSGSCMGWRAAWYPASCCMMTGPLSSAVSPGKLSSIPLGSARSPRSSSGVDGSSPWRSGRPPLVLLVECRLGLLPCLTSRTW